jgi:hypothetical protein
MESPKAGYHLLRREFSLTEGAGRELAVIWDLAVASNVSSWRGIMVLELAIHPLPFSALPRTLVRACQMKARGSPPNTGASDAGP